jgi:hypothetical protein
LDGKEQPMTASLMLNMEWIAASDQLPDDEICVLICMADDEVWIGFHDGDEGWHFVSGESPDSIVTHWMQLPPPPESTP